MNKKKSFELGHVESCASDLKAYKKSNPNLAKKIAKTMRQLAEDVAKTNFRSGLEVEYIESHKPIKSAHIDRGYRLSFEIVSEDTCNLLLFRVAGEHDKVYKSPRGTGEIIRPTDLT